MKLKRSKLEKSLKHIEEITGLGQEIVRNLTVGNEYFSGWRIEDLKKNYDSLKKEKDQKEYFIENELYRPLDYQLGRTKKIAKRIKYRTMMNKKYGGILEDDYNVLNEADLVLNKTFMKVSSHYDSFLNSSGTHIEDYEKEWRDFAEYTFSGMNPILKQYDEMIAKTKEIRKRYKKTKRIDLDALKEMIEKDIEVSETYRDFSKELNEKYKETTEKSIETTKTLDSAFNETKNNINDIYNNDDFQKAIHRISTLEADYPSVGKYIIKKTKIKIGSLEWSLENKVKNKTKKIKEYVSNLKNRDKGNK